MRAEGFRREEAVRAGVNALDDGIFFRGIEIRGAQDDPENVGRAIAALGDEALGPEAAARENLGGVGGFERADERAVGRAAQFRDGRRIDARPRVDERVAVRREAHLVRAVAGGEDDEAGAVEVHAAKMEVIGIFAGDDAAGEERELASLGVHAGDTADDPLSGGDRVFQATAGGVVEVEMVPAAAFAGPDNFLRVVEDFLMGRNAGVVDEGLAALLDDDARGTRGGIDRDEAEELVTALVVEKREGARVGLPVKPRELPRHGEEGGIDRDFAAVGNGKQARALRRDFVAGLEIGIGVLLRLELVDGRGLGEVNAALGDGARLEGEEVVRIGRPENVGQRGRRFGFLKIHADEPVARRVVVKRVGGTGVETERVFGGAVRGAEPEVVLTDVGLPLAVGRTHARARRFRGGKRRCERDVIFFDRDGERGRHGAENRACRAIGGGHEPEIAGSGFGFPTGRGAEIVSGLRAALGADVMHAKRVAAAIEKEHAGGFGGRGIGGGRWEWRDGAAVLARLVGREVESPRAHGAVEDYGFARWGKLEGLDGERGGGHARMVERRGALAGGGIDEDEFARAAGEVVAIPERGVAEPDGLDVRAVDFRRGLGGGEREGGGGEGEECEGATRSERAKALLKRNSEWKRSHKRNVTSRVRGRRQLV